MPALSAPITRARTSTAICIVLLICLGAFQTLATTYYVSASGSDSNDGLTPGQALATIGAGVGLATTAGDIVLVDDGTYGITAQIDLTLGITVKSANGAAVTTVELASGTSRLFSLSHPDAMLQGLTLDGGVAPTSLDRGGGVYMTDGTVLDCVITGCKAVFGAGIYMEGGIVHGCDLLANPTKSGGGASGRGGGVYMTAGTVEFCEFAGNTSVRAGGAVRIGGGVVRNCIVSGSTSGHSGGGFAMEGGGRVENCLMYGNASGTYPPNTGGGGIYMNNNACQVAHCTVADNESKGTGGGIYVGRGTVENCIVYHNTKTETGTADDLINALGTVSYSCAPELTSGAGNITTIPEFEDRGSADYHLRPGSPCLDTGSNLAAVVTDLEGATRPEDGDNDSTATSDMGAYEAPAGNAGSFRCNFVANPNQGNVSLNATFNAAVYGPNIAGLIYAWDFTNDGVDDLTGAGLSSVNHLYGTPGVYSVRLTVQNSLSETVARVRTGYIVVYAAITYVSTTGSDTAPYDSWATAADTFQEAIDAVMAGGQVYVADGVYSPAEPVSIERGVTVQSVNGAALTTVQRAGAGTRLFSLGHANAVLDGFTITGGIAPTSADTGGGVFMTDGTVRNCVITACKAVYGAGVYMTGGTVTNCTLTANPTKSGGGDSGRGGGVYMTGGTVAYSAITQNTSVRAGAGVRMSGGLVRNCVVRGNTSGHGGGGFAMETGGRVENCLIYDNASGSFLGGGGGIFMNNASCEVVNCTVADNMTTGVGGGIYRSNGSVTNTIVYDNTLTATGAADNIAPLGAATDAAFDHSCSPDLTNDPGGTGNITALPGFADQPNDDYSLSPGSACIDTGAAVAAITDDVAGTARPLDGDGVGGAAYDIGAYEAPDAGGGPLSINFSAPTTEGNLTLAVTFTAAATGSDTVNLYYNWDFDNDGVVDDQGYGKDVVNHTYAAPGFYSVKLTVTNGSSETASETKLDYIKVYAAITYVSLSGPDVAPYDTPAKAATSLQPAIDAVMEGGLVLVADGTYALTEQVLLTRGVTVRSTGGETNAIIGRDPSGDRLFSLGHAAAVLDGFTLTGGSAPTGADTGGGVFMSEGTVTNCIITDCRAVYGAGVYMTGGTLSRCLLIDNPTKSGGGSSGQGGGVYMTGGTVEHCEFVGNTAVRSGGNVRQTGGLVTHCTMTSGSSGHGGGGINMTGGTARNCAIVGNYGASYLSGGGVYMSGSSVLECCTVVGNRALGDGGGIRIAGGTVTNCIVVGNEADASGQEIYGVTGGIGYSCSADLVHDPSGTGNISSDPLFVANGSGYGLAHTAGNYQLLSASPCIDAGLLQAWMTGAEDLAAAPRVNAVTVDMGAFENAGPTCAEIAAEFLSRCCEAFAQATPSQLSSDAALLALAEQVATQLITETGASPSCVAELVQLVADLL